MKVDKINKLYDKEDVSGYFIMNCFTSKEEVISRLNVIFPTNAKDEQLFAVALIPIDEEVEDEKCFMNL